jgi:hypothetical protein
MHTAVKKIKFNVHVECERQQQITLFRISSFLHTKSFQPITDTLS